MSGSSSLFSGLFNTSANDAYAPKHLQRRNSMPVYSEVPPRFMPERRSKDPEIMEYVQVDVKDVNDHTPVSAVSAEQAALLLPGYRRMRADSETTKGEKKRLTEEIAVLEKVLGEISAPLDFGRRITPAEKPAAVEVPNAKLVTAPADTIQADTELKQHSVTQPDSDAPVRALSEQEAAFQLPGLRRLRNDSKTTREERTRLTDEITRLEKLAGEVSAPLDFGRRITPMEKPMTVEMSNVSLVIEPPDTIDPNADGDAPARELAPEEAAAFKLPGLRRLRKDSKNTPEERMRLSQEITVLETVANEGSFDATLFEHRITPNVKSDNEVDQSAIRKVYTEKRENCIINVDCDKSPEAVTPEQAAIMLPGYRRMRNDLQTTQEQRKRLSQEIKEMEVLLGVETPADFGRRITPSDKIRSGRTLDVDHVELPWRKLQAEHREKHTEKLTPPTEMMQSEELPASRVLTPIVEAAIVRPMSKEEAAFALPGFRRMRADPHTSEEERQRLTKEIFMLEKVASGDVTAAPKRHITRRQSTMW